MGFSMSKRTLQHPRALYTLFFAEFWERFCFYGIQALFVLYLTQAMHLDDKKAYLLYGAYISFNYATPVIGGYLADKVIGFRNSITLGAILIILGNIFLATNQHNFLYLGLAFIIWGTGFFKPNVASLVGQLYSANDPRRDSGFTIFYLGINAGGLIGSLIYGYLANAIGWPAAFSAGAVGMLFGGILFYHKQKILGEKGLAPKRHTFEKSKPFFTKFWLLIPLLMLAIVGVSYMLNHSSIVGYILNGFGILMLIILLVIAFNYSAKIRNRIFAILLLNFYNVAWSACFFQITGAITLYIERNVTRHFTWPTNFTIPSTWFFASEAFFIIAFGPLLARLWSFLNKHGLDPSTPTKFALSLLITTVSFAILTMSTHFAQINGHCSPIWIVLVYVIFAIGELCMSPIGLSAITKYAPRKLVGLFIGIWFLGSAYAGYLAGLLSRLASVEQNPKTHTIDLKAAALSYGNLFSKTTIALGIVTVISFILIPLTKKLLTADKMESPKTKVM